MFRQQREHVVKEWNTRCHLRLAAPVNHERQRNLRLCCITRNLSASFLHKPPSLLPETCPFPHPFRCSLARSRGCGRRPTSARECFSLAARQTTASQSILTVAWPTKNNLAPC